MFLSFLKSMQNKSQDAQNPGLWVNGMRQPIQENEKRAQKIIDWNHNGVISKAENELTDFAKGQIAAEDADARGEHEAEMKAENGWRNSGGYRGSDEDGGRELNAINNEIDNGVLVGGEDFSQEPFNDTRRRAAQTAEDAFNNKMNPPDPREGMAPDSEDLHNPGKISSFTKKKPMQENTNRSMFLTHLQGMQTKSQGAQNPGLWVNGNRMPVQESLLGAAVRGIGQVAKFGYDLGNNLGNGMMNAANTAVSGSPLKRPARYGDAGPVRPEDFIRPRPSPGSRPDWAPDYPYPNPSPRPNPGGRLPGLINPKPKSPTDITVDDIINPNTGNVSLSTGEANKPGAVTLYPEGQNILNPPAKSKSGLGDIIDRPGLPKRKPDLMRPGTYGGGERRPNLDVIGGPDDPYAPGGSKTREYMNRLRKIVNSGEAVGVIPPTDPNLMNRMY